MTVTRLLAVDDAPALTELLLRNRDFLRPWQPSRPPGYFTVSGQAAAIDASMRSHRSGTSVPLVITDRNSQIFGMVTLQSIIRGCFQSCSVGYWLDKEAQGKGLATRGLQEAIDMAFETLRLHRVQAETLVVNDRSSRLLERVGFTHYGTAKDYLKIDNRWQDHHLYELLTPTPGRVNVQ